VRLVGWNTADVHRAQPPEPIGNAKCITGGSVDEFCGGPPIPVSWACCVNPPQNVEPIPAPPIVAKVYPHPPSTRPQKGKASVVFFLTDDQDKLLGSVDVMNHTKSLFVDGGAVFDNFFVSAQSPRVRGFNVHEHRLLLSICLSPRLAGAMQCNAVRNLAHTVAGDNTNLLSFSNLYLVWAMGSQQRRSGYNSCGMVFPRKVCTPRFFVCSMLPAAM
jgi:hypothetical protein